MWILYATDQFAFKDEGPENFRRACLDIARYPTFNEFRKAMNLNLPKQEQKEIINLVYRVLEGAGFKGPFNERYDVYRIAIELETKEGQENVALAQEIFAFANLRGKTIDAFLALIWRIERVKRLMPELTVEEIKGKTKEALKEFYPEYGAERFFYKHFDLAFL